MCVCVNKHGILRTYINISHINTYVYIYKTCIYICVYMYMCMASHMSRRRTHVNALRHTYKHATCLVCKAETSDQCTATHCNTLQHTATHCNTLQHTATHCNALQYTATQSHVVYVKQRLVISALQYTATHCNTLQHTATHCNTLQHTATHCNTLQNNHMSFM